MPSRFFQPGGNGLLPGFGRGAAGGGAGAWSSTLSANATTAANAVVTEVVTNGWKPDLSAVTWDDTVVVSGSTQLNAFLRNGTAVGGVTLNTARNQRVKVSATGDYTWATTNLIEIRGKDFQTGGKVLLIEAETASPDITSSFTVSGSRGVYIRNLNFVQGLNDRSGDVEWSPYKVNSVAITAGGTGYTVNDVLTGTGGTKDAAATLRVDTVSAGVITAVTVTYGGKTVTVAPTGWSGGTGTGFTATSTLIANSGNPRDTVQVTFQRTSTFPLFCTTVVEGCKFGPRYKATPDTNNQRITTALTSINNDQLYVLNCQFGGTQTAIKPTNIRRYWSKGNDFQYFLGDCQIVLNSAGNTAVAGANTYNVQYPDLLSYSLIELNTVRNPIDACNAVNGRGEDLRWDQEHTDGVQFGTSADTTNYKNLVRYNAMHAARTTYQDRNQNAVPGSTTPAVRVNGGTQFLYQDDCGATFNIDTVAHDNIAATSVANSIVFYNGTGYCEWNTQIRGKNYPASASVGVDGFTYSTDSGNGVIGHRQGVSASATLNASNNVSGLVQSLVNPNDATINASNNTTVDPRASAVNPNRYSDVFTTAFLAGNKYVLDETVSQSAFRAALAAQAAVSITRGASSPAVWPA